MSRRDRQRMAERAAEAASEAGRTLQAQRGADSEGGESLEPQGEDQASQATEPVVRRDPGDNPRNQVMEEIMERRNKESGIEPPKEEPVAAVVEQQQQEAVPSDTTPVEPEAPVIKTVRVKVDGEEFDAPEDDVNDAGGIKPYQIMKAQENRLKKTTEALAESRKMQASLAQFLQQQADAAAQQRGPAKTPSQEMQEKIDLIRYGTPEESAAALQGILDSQRVDPNAIVAQAMQMVKRDQAENAFVQEFSDLVHNPMILRLIIGLKDERIASAAQNKQPIQDWSHFYRSIGNEVRNAIGKPSQQANPQGTQVAQAALTADSTSQGLSEKEARKASIVNLPKAAARAAVPEADKPESREDVLNQMRKSRGLQTG